MRFQHGMKSAGTHIVHDHDHHQQEFCGDRNEGCNSKCVILSVRNDSSSSRGVSSSDSGVAIEAKSRKTITRPFHFLYHIYVTLGYDVMYCKGGGSNLGEFEQREEKKTRRSRR